MDYVSEDYYVCFCFMFWTEYWKISKKYIFEKQYFWKIQYLSFKYI